MTYRRRVVGMPRSSVSPDGRGVFSSASLTLRRMFLAHYTGHSKALGGGGLRKGNRKTQVPNGGTCRTLVKGAAYC
jgi:hypothetical protein